MTILIKKYENRRLYNSTNSRYVNLEDVAALLQRGNDVRVVDATSGEDITRLILTQIIVENAKTPNSHLPVDILRQMVIASGRASQESAVKYMKTMLEIYQDTYRAMAPSLENFESAPSSGKAQKSPASSSRDQIPEIKTRSKVSRAAQTNDKSEVDSLKDRLAELEHQVSLLTTKTVRRKK